MKNNKITLTGKAEFYNGDFIYTHFDLFVYGSLKTQQAAQAETFKALCEANYGKQVIAVKLEPVLQ